MDIEIMQEQPPVRKSKYIAGLLGILFGWLGLHNFYLGFTGKAFAQLLITVVSLGTLGWISLIWGIVEGFRCLTGSIILDSRNLMLQ
jgi:TM2 domain-containing membrane protein YozV